MDFVVRCCAFGLFATSLNLLIGYTGMTSFGHGMFFGLGAYVFGILMQRTGMPIPLAVLLTIVVVAVVAAAVGAICARLKDIYFAFVTLAFQMLLHSLIISLPALTGGDQGLRGGIPRPAFFGVNLAEQSHLYMFSVALLLLGAALVFGETAIVTKALVTIVFIFLTAPVAGHLLGRAAYASRIPLWDRSLMDEGRGQIGILPDKTGAPGRPKADSPPA